MVSAMADNSTEMKLKLKVSHRYDAWTPFYDAIDNFPIISRPQRRWRLRAVELSTEILPRYLLDVGSGSGYILPWVMERMENDALVVALDISKKMLLRSRERVIRYSGRHVTCVHVLSDSDNMPFKDNTFDSIIATFAFTSIPNYKKSIIECIRVLKKGGRMVVLDTGPPERRYAVPFHKTIGGVARIFGYTYMDRDIPRYLASIKSIKKITEERYSGTIVYILVYEKR